MLLVAWHTIGNGPTSGLEVPADSYWRFFADFFIYFRMPMFAFISGYVYASKPFAGQASRFLAGKTRRLLLPLFIVGTSFALVEWLVPGTNVNKYNIVPHWATLHLVPVAHYWFLRVPIHHFCCCGSLGFPQIVGRSMEVRIHFGYRCRSFSDGRGPALSWLIWRCLSVPIFSLWACLFAFPY